MKTMQWLTTLWHKTLHRPYQLYCRDDIGQGQAVVLLHGIAASAETWQHVVTNLTTEPCRVVTFDLLGFGESPKPTFEWLHYNVDDHARAVIASLSKHSVPKPIILVGHSMGCLIAVHIAKLRPDLVKQLILYEPPFFTGLPGSTVYQRQRNFYARTYRNLIKRPPLGLGSFRFLQKLIARMIGFELTKETWIPFERSMKSTILEQNAVAELHGLVMPTDIIYGKYDGLVINDKKRYFFDVAAKNIVTSEAPELHMISKRASQMMATRISELLKQSRS